MSLIVRPNHRRDLALRDCTFLWANEKSGGGANAIDLSRYRHQGSKINYEPSWESRTKFGRSLDLDGSNDYLSWPTSPHLDFPSNTDGAILCVVETFKAPTSLNLIVKRLNSGASTQWNMVQVEDWLAGSAGTRLSVGLWQNFSDRRVIRTPSGTTENGVHAILVSWRAGDDSSFYFSYDGRSLPWSFQVNSGAWPSIVNSSPLEIARESGSPLAPGHKVACATWRRYITLQEAHAITRDPTFLWRGGAEIIPFPQAAGGKTVVVGTATETDSTVAVTASRAHSIGTSAETDAASAISALRARAVGAASETDAATSIAPNRARAVGTAVESDTAPAIAAPLGGAVGTAVESDIASNVIPLRAYAVGPATVNETAQVIAARRSIAVGLAVESDTASNVIPLRSYTVGPATETETA